MSIIPYYPGQPLPERRTSRPYDNHRNELYEIYSDVFFSNMYGFDRTRQPRPGQEINGRAFEQWQDKVMNSSLKQKFYDFPMPMTTNPQKSDLPENLWRYWYGSMMEMRH